jgi:hypothetical protein
MTILALSTAGRLSLLVKRSREADPRFIVGSITGLVGAWLVTGDPSLHGIGMTLWVVSNATFIHLWLKQFNPWMLAMQTAYLIITVRGLVRVYGADFSIAAHVVASAVAQLLG